MIWQQCFSQHRFMKQSPAYGGLSDTPTLACSFIRLLVFGIPVIEPAWSAALRSEAQAAKQSSGAGLQPAHDKVAVAAKPVAQMEHVEEAKRLLQERSSLLKTGSYSKESAVIQQLDAKIQELGNKALGTWAPPS